MCKQWLSLAVARHLATSCLLCHCCNSKVLSGRVEMQQDTL